MYSENFHSEDDYNPPHRKKPNGMATASVILGIVALSSITFPLSAVIFGALSILCALLSRTDRMPKRSIAGLILSFVSIAGSSFMVWRTVSYLQKNPQMLAYYQEMVHSILEEYGMSDVYDNLFGKYNSTYQLPQERKDDRENDQSETPSENSGNDSGNYSDDYGSFFGDLYRYYFDDGAVPSPSEPSNPFSPSSPSVPSNDISGGEFV